jgi:hypothetical protein
MDPAYTATHGLFAISGLSVLAQVSGLLFSKIQLQRLLMDHGPPIAEGLWRWSTDHVLSRSSLYGYQQISSYKRLKGPRNHLAIGGLRVLATTHL